MESAENKNEDKLIVVKKQSNAKFYLGSRDYWSKQPATVNGMLGGYENISEIDLNQSQEILDWLFTVN